VFQS